jgi:hypothetical protein
MRNTCLYKALREYCNSALAFLNSKVSGPEDVPTTIKEKVEVAERVKHYGRLCNAK